MFKFLTLWNRELSSYFQSAIAYVVLFFFLLATGWNFQYVVTAINLAPVDVSVVQGFFNNPFFWFPYILIFPLITMRTFSEEFKLGTIETLMTAPVTDLQVVLSKFAGAVFFYIILWLPSLLYFTLFQSVAGANSATSPGSIWGSYAILLLLGMFYISVGCFASVVTNNQIIAAVISGVCVALFFFLGFVSLFALEIDQYLRDLLSYFSAIDHMATFSKGIIDSRPIVFYLSMTALFLTLTYHVFQRRKWKS